MLKFLADRIVVMNAGKEIFEGRLAEAARNAQVVEVGDGFWKTAEGRGNYMHIFADPEFWQVAYMGPMREAGGPQHDGSAPPRS